MLSFELQDEIWSLFRSSPEVLSILGVTDDQDYDQLNTRIRREECPVSLLTPDVLPFVSLVFINSHRTGNHLVNNGVLELSIYTSTRYDAMRLFKVLKELLQNRYEDFSIVHEGQIPSGVVGIYQYSIRFSPFISA